MTTSTSAQAPALADPVAAEPGGTAAPGQFPRDRSVARRRRRRAVSAVDLGLLTAGVAIGTALLPRRDAPVVILAVLMVALWWPLLARRDRVVGSIGSSNPVPVIESAAQLASAVAVLGLLVEPAAARAHLTMTIPAVLVLLLVARLLRRAGAGRRRTRSAAGDRTLVVGPLATIGPALDALARSPQQAVGICLVAGVGEPPVQVRGVPVLGTAADVRKIVERDDVDMVVVTAGTDSRDVEHVGWLLEASPVGFAVALPLVEVDAHRISRPTSGPIPLARVALTHHRGARYAVKRGMDILGSALALVVLLPVLAVVAVAVKVSSPGPVLYRQSRVGRGGRRFSVLKFRSMVVGAHDLLAEVLQAEGVAQVGLFYKPKNDPRITPVGRFLRTYSLDELPQLINVLRGDMSLVGPRPQIDAEVAQYDDRARRRLLVRPGCTGPWQVSGRSDLDPAEGIRLDVRYVENWTFRSDLHILARTVRVMIAGAGAY